MAVVRECLPLHLVSARDRYGFRVERDDQDGVCRGAGRGAGGGGDTVKLGQGAGDPALSGVPGGAVELAFVRVGTLEVPSACPPDIHIFTATKLDWLVLDGPEPGGRVPVVTAYYVRETYWPAESLRRRKGMLGKG